MRVALRRIDGVASAEVSLNSGVAVVRFKPENRVAVEQIRDVVRSNGFTPKAADVRVRGRVVEEQGELMLVLPGENQRYRLAADPQVPGATDFVRESAGRTVLIEGTVPEEGKGQARVESIQVRSVTPVMEGSGPPGAPSLTSLSEGP